MSVRRNRVIAFTLMLFLGGLAYAFFAVRTGISVPCLFHLITGLDCPSCGISRMCIALLRLNFAAAFRYNAAIFCMLPLIAVMYVHIARRYIRHNTVVPAKWATVCIVFMIIALLIFGVVRNLT